MVVTGFYVCGDHVAQETEDVFPYAKLAILSQKLKRT